MSFWPKAGGISSIQKNAEKQPSAGAAGNFLAPITQLSSNAFKTVIDIDVLGSYNTVKATLPHLVTSARKHNSNSKPASQIAGTGGRVIFVSATFHYTAVPLQTHVSVAKAGVDALSNNLALEFGPRGVTSNVIAPGGIAGTEGMERLSQTENVEKALKVIPLGRLGTVKEIADATVYLFSDAGNYVNGQTLVGESCFPIQVARWRDGGADMILLDSQSMERRGGRSLLIWAGSSIRISCWVMIW